jgi:GDP-L-fucose synthase
MERNSKIFVAGHRGLVGSAIIRCLQKYGYNNLLVRTHQELDLRSQTQVNRFFEEEKPEYVFLAAAKVGGILANSLAPADFCYDNLLISANVIHASKHYNVKKLLFLGSSCIYPKMVSQPIKEEYLLTGALEPTNEGYALAKITGMQLCKFYRRQYGCDFISAMPTNLYGINDNFDLNSSHVLPAMIRKFHEGKLLKKHEVVLWGTGTVLREFLFVDDLADALVHLMNHYSAESHVNVGTGEDLSIHELALMVKDVVGYRGDIVYDSTKPDGTPRKLLDVSLLHSTGWHHQVSLRQGIETVYKWYQQQNQ